ncbi:hypothetical protein M885DRAFT_293753 [Pelagophyceae sp. CCMP2097]|nr:hypothetical protein M885DRAFT_293753 [Pelagophyceae sp. CCMP2097]|mmetsp:Transcript_26173/g.90311  ORF Transcript_26173/g.90311 Transcript_26173/m.90311 type:complete len:220 (+) Transcript_26173:708-1367(+)
MDASHFSYAKDATLSKKSQRWIDSTRTADLDLHPAPLRHMHPLGPLTKRLGSRCLDGGCEAPVEEDSAKGDQRSFTALRKELLAVSETLLRGGLVRVRKRHGPYPGKPRLYALHANPRGGFSRANYASTSTRLGVEAMDVAVGIAVVLTVYLFIAFSVYATFVARLVPRQTQRRLAKLAEDTADSSPTAASDLRNALGEMDCGFVDEVLSTRFWPSAFL